MNLQVVGQSCLRPDAPEKLTGRAKYIDDLTFAGMLHCVVVRSPYAKAKILSIDCTAARAMPGVWAVATWKDIPGNNFVALVKNDLPLLAQDSVEYAAQAVALVAAETKQQAQAAAEKVVVEYEQEQPILGIDEGIEKGWVLCKYQLFEGDVDKAFADPTLQIFEKTYYTPLQEHAYLETNGIIAVPDNRGGLIVYGSMQCPFYVQKGVAYALGVDFQRVRVVQTTTGGGFGGKEDAPSTPGAMASVMAWITKRPVKLVLSRGEDMACMTKRHPSKIVYRSAVTKDGIIKAVDIKHYVDGGAFLTLSSIVLWRGLIHSTGPYNIENVRVLSYAIGTNTPPNGAFRGFGQPQVVFAAEAHWDEVASRLGMAPLEFRNKNVLSCGMRTATGQILTESVGLQEVADKALAAAGYHEFMKQPRSQGRYRRGMGVSYSHYGVGLGANGGPFNNAGANVIIAADGSVSIGVGTVEMGQGMTTVLIQIAAETLRCDTSRIYLVDPDTAQVPESGPTVASRTTLMCGNAVYKACKELRERLDEFDNGRNLEWKALIGQCWVAGVQLSVQGWAVAPKCTFDEATGKGDVYCIYTWCVNVADVTVDTLTGEVTVNRFISGNDVGKVVNPSLAEGQAQGGALQGLGYALVEQGVLKEGRLLSNSLSTYILPTAMDTPEIVPVFAEHEYSWGPYGAKGFGETPLVPVAPAVINAIADATGVRINTLPATPERVWQALRDLEQK